MLKELGSPSELTKKMKVDEEEEIESYESLDISVRGGLYESSNKGPTGTTCSNDPLPFQIINLRYKEYFVRCLFTIYPLIRFYAILIRFFALLQHAINIRHLFTYLQYVSRYDWTPIENISVVATEHGLIPPTSIPVLVEELRAEESNE